VLLLIAYFVLFVLCFVTFTEYYRCNPYRLWLFLFCIHKHQYFAINCFIYIN